MRRYLLACIALTSAHAGAQELLLTGPLRAPPPPPQSELHVFGRFGAAWSNAKAGLMQSASLGATFDVVHFSRTLAFVVVADIDDRRFASANAWGVTSYGGGVGLMYAAPTRYALAIDATSSADWDGRAFAAGGLAVRAALQPFYLDMRQAQRCAGGPVAAFVASAIEIWVLGRVDFGDPSLRGVTVAFGVGLDLMRAVVAPTFIGARSAFHPCANPRSYSKAHLN